MKPFRHYLVFALVLWVVFVPETTHAGCSGFFNPVTDVEWTGIFPIKIAGIPIGKSGLKEPSDPSKKPWCVCPTPLGVPRPGIPLSFWEPARLIETVKTPFCFPTIGVSAGNSGGRLAGAHTPGYSKSGDATTFAQAHFFIFPIMSMLGIDWLCFEPSTFFDVGYITEVDPLWNDDELAFIINPEAILFGNIIAQEACAADAIAANAGLPIDSLYWCYGSHGSGYPMTGHVMDNNYVQANLAIAERLISKMSRQLLIPDGATDLCTFVPMPIARKSHWRFQVAKPHKGSQVIPWGRTAMIWGANKNSLNGKGDQFMWVVFRKRACCVL